MNTETWPLAESIAEKVALSDCLVVCAVTLDLYGYKQAMFDDSKARTLFFAAYKRATGYAPSGHEISAAVCVLRQRFEILEGKR